MTIFWLFSTFCSLNYHFQSLLCPLLLYQLDLLWYKFMNQNNVYYKSPSRFLICLCVWYYYHHHHHYYILNLHKRNLFIIIKSPIYYLFIFICSFYFYTFLYVGVVLIEGCRVTGARWWRIRKTKKKFRRSRIL